MTDRSGVAKTGAEWLGWMVWGLAAAFYGYGFFQRVAPSVMADHLMRDFAVGATLLGNLTAFYFYAYAIMQIPIGMLLDRFGARLMLSLSALLCAAGSIAFGMADSLMAAYIGRLLIGLGSAVTWIGALYVAAEWMPPSRFAILTGLTLGTGTLFAVVGQAPLGLVVQSMGWRATMIWSGGFAGLLAAAIWLLARAPKDRPDESPASGKGLWAQIADAARLRQTWVIAFFVGSIPGPLLSFGGLWGVPYLMQSHAMSRTEAAGMVSIILISWSVAAPVYGWISERLGRRRPVMLAASACGILAWTLFALIPQLPIFAIGLLLALAGLAGGGMVVGFTVARESSPPGAAGSVSGLANTFVMGSGAMMQPLVGWLLDRQWDGTMIDGVRFFSEPSYRLAFLTFPIVGAIGFLIGTMARDTGRNAP